MLLRGCSALTLGLALAACTNASPTGAGGGGHGGYGGGGHGGAPVTSSGSSSGDMLDGGADDAADASDGAMFDCDVLGVPGNCLDVMECEAKPSYAPQAGFCPGPASIQCCTLYGDALCDPSVVVSPNAGSTAEAAGEGGCPKGMLRVTDAMFDFCIDRFEASLVRVSDGTAWSPYLNPGMTAVRAVSVEGVVPQGYINGVQAAAACAAAGKRLCDDDEWLRACQGPTDTTYPYGNTLVLGECNDHRQIHPAIQYFGTTDSWIFSEIDNACLNQLPQGLDKTGARQGCVTAEGALDMMGNLHEWTSDPAGTFRGGFYVDTVQNGPGCLYATKAHDTSHWDYSTGFRCCKTP